MPLTRYALSLILALLLKNNSWNGRWTLAHLLTEPLTDLNQQLELHLLHRCASRPA